MPLLRERTATLTDRSRGSSRRNRSRIGNECRVTVDRPAPLSLSPVIVTTGSLEIFDTGIGVAPIAMSLEAIRTREFVHNSSRPMAALIDGEYSSSRAQRGGENKKSLNARSSPRIPLIVTFPEDSRDDRLESDASRRADPMVNETKSLGFHGYPKISGRDRTLHSVAENYRTSKIRRTASGKPAPLRSKSSHGFSYRMS